MNVMFALVRLRQVASNGARQLYYQGELVINSNTDMHTEA
jgi:hypothetical protein